MPASPDLPPPRAREDEPSPRRDEVAAWRETPVLHHPDADREQGSRGHGQVIAAALVRVAPLAGPGMLVPGGRAGARVGVTLQTVSAVDWLSAGRARGAA